VSRLFVFAGGVLFAGSLLFFAIRYASFFGADVPWSWAHGWKPAAIDVVLFVVFALHHSIFARTRLRAFVERHAPAGTERAIYVWVASLLFIGVTAAWQPVPGVLWSVTGPPALVFSAVQFAGIAFILLAVRRLGPLTLAGIRDPEASPTLVDDGAYGLVRHPIYLGWFLIVWSPAIMNGTRLVFAAVSCAYLIVAVVFEERDLRRTFGEAYVRYAQRVRSKMIPGIY
jgi:protein-S-isoprenylcysteine O-methyltransferase Ste14